MPESLTLFDQVEDSLKRIEEIKKKLKKPLKPKNRTELEKKIKRLALTRQNCMSMLKNLN